MDFQADRLATTIAAGPPARLVVLFGSAAQGRMRDHSDVDIGWIPADADLSLGDELTFQANLTAAAGREVDLLRLDQASTILRYDVARDGILLAGPRSEFVRFRAEAIGEYLDFEPALREASERFRRAILAGIGKGKP